jgi:hypothetical protein
MQMKRLLVLALVCLPLLLQAAPALAQCAMCQTALMNSAEGRGIGQEFNRAILTMLFAPYVVFGSVGAVLLRHRIRDSVRASVRRWRAALHRSAAPSPDRRVH